MDDKDCKQIKGALRVESNEGGGVKFGDDGKTAFAEDRSAYSAMFYAIPRATVWHLQPTSLLNRNDQLTRLPCVW